jgi:hypothetical protein
LVGALKGEWSDAKANRERAERRVAELEGIERDLAADRSEVEALRETWKSWSATLEQATYAGGLGSRGGPGAGATDPPEGLGRDHRGHAER